MDQEQRKTAAPPGVSARVTEKIKALVSSETGAKRVASMRQARVIVDSNGDIVFGFADTEFLLSDEGRAVMGRVKAQMMVAEASKTPEGRLAILKVLRGGKVAAEQDATDTDHAEH